MRWNLHGLLFYDLPYWYQWHGKFNVRNARKAGQEELEKGLHGCCLRLLEPWWNSDALFDKRPFRSAFILNKNLSGFKYAIFEWFNQSIDNQVIMYSLASVVIIWCGEMLQNNVRLPRNLYCFGLWNASFGSLKWLMLQLQVRDMVILCAWNDREMSYVFIFYFYLLRKSVPFYL